MDDTHGLRAGKGWSAGGWRGAAFVVWALVAAGPLAQAAPEKPLAGMEVIMDIPDVAGTRQRTLTDAKGRFELVAPAPGQYRMLIQFPEPAVAASHGTSAPAAPASSADIKIRQAQGWGRAERYRSRIKYLDLALEPTVSSGESRSTERVVNGRTPGRLVYFYQKGEVLRGRVMEATP